MIMRSPYNIYQQRGSPRILVRDSIFLKCMFYKMHYVYQLSKTFRVAVLKLSLIFRALKVGFYVLL